MSCRFAGYGVFKWRLAPSNVPPADVSLIMVITCDGSDETHRNSFAPPAGSSAATIISTAVTAVGCPFGVTAHQHFSGLQYRGVISQVVQVSAKKVLVKLVCCRCCVGCASPSARTCPTRTLPMPLVSMQAGCWQGRPAAGGFQGSARHGGRPGIRQQRRARGHGGHAAVHQRL